MSTTNITNVLFFPGTSANKCVEYFPMFNLLTKDKWETLDNKENPIILCHGHGVRQAIEWCHKNNVMPKVIISMDGAILNDLEHLDVKKYNIYLLRQAWKRALKDIEYKYVTYYSGTNHHPYTDTRLRDLVLLFIEFDCNR